MSGQSTRARKNYAVGYARPPIATRFQKGQSGNPGGRRKKDDHYVHTDELIMEEAFRLVTVREGDKVIKIPALQAILRSQIQLAAKGNQAAQRAVLDYVLRVENKHEARHEELLQALFAFKAEASNQRARLIEKGLPIGPDVPHPDDVSLDLHTGDVYFHHPDFAEEARPHRRVDQVRITT
ncbi:hypothetical protein MMSR116_04630 [Methylobacterium mesophilicum SR1.6/6]|uniref:DUF5681 domain-containing protein n=1 Tax=Methylobacterium mesophilicum SR1.6/6 TaxID=908290 RepID=A0A6B9FES0_9HYPH|nr:DUF5681 domain-containing protein [Methylobacterium mesophilicum]QGY01267.1 hypothetical protein MMSR116_04630 [Methylobacterium mesophilicum SR1.6/6]